MKFSIRKQWIQARSLTLEAVPLLTAALLVFVALLVLGPITYVFTGIDINGTLIVGNAW